MQFTPTQQRAAAWLGIFAVCVGVLVGLGPVLMPFVVGAGLAYALSPLVGGLYRASRGHLPRLACVLLVECVFLLVALGLVTLLIPILVKATYQKQLSQALFTVSGSDKNAESKWHS